LRILGVHSISGRQLRGIFIADESPLTDFLSAAENPAHTEWQAEAEGFSQSFTQRKATLNFIKNCFSRIISIISRPLEDVDTDILAEFFPFERKGSSLKKSKKPSKRKGKKSNVPQPPKEKSFPIAIISKIDNGFKVRRNIEYIKELNSIEIAVAYSTIRGDPLKRYSVYDFNFENNDLQILESGVNVIHKKENKIYYEIENHEFYVEITGFDENRDLFIKVSKVN